uniref:Uncharacterized protein n=1 Tax=Arundo donax TaxID=35708 RepID=A0A0A9QIN0_ARUDO
MGIHIVVKQTARQKKNQSHVRTRMSGTQSWVGSFFVRQDGIVKSYFYQI